jgi:hypothetical protein
MHNRPMKEYVQLPSSWLTELSTASVGGARLGMDGNATG